VSPPASRRTAFRTLSLIALVCLAPVVASYAVYYLFPRDRQVNYGVLLPTAPAPQLAGVAADGAQIRLDELRGKWVLLTIGGDGCDAACERGLYATRQARTMQGRDQDRIVRILLLAGETLPGAEVAAQHPGLVVVLRAPSGRSVFHGTAGTAYLIDPLGNLVLRYPEDPDIKGIAKDLGRLLKASRIG
jgi:cytochrome oxidase Cu insertion factor (SCO1/SenC/PrrC family)